jgi:hypothetical protein
MVKLRQRAGKLGAVAAVLMLLAPVAMLAQAAEPVAGSSAEIREWRFRVLLDDKEVGHHSFRVARGAAGDHVQIDAQFDVRFLFFDVFSYRHSNTERWSDGCLEAIESDTQSGQEEYRVRGYAQPQAFHVETLDGEFSLADSCIRSFAYWDHRLITSPRLLNAQTGEWIEVQTAPAGRDTLSVMGREVPARRYDLELEKGVISVWYDLEGTWLALQAPAPGGRSLRYIPEQIPVVTGDAERFASH